MPRMLLQLWEYQYLKSTKSHGIWACFDSSKEESFVWIILVTSLPAAIFGQLGHFGLIYEGRRHDVTCFKYGVIKVFINVFRNQRTKYEILVKRKWDLRFPMKMSSSISWWRGTKNFLNSTKNFENYLNLASISEMKTRPSRPKCFSSLTLSLGV